MRKLLRVSLLITSVAVPIAAGAGQSRLVRLGRHEEPGFFPSRQGVALLPDGRFATVWTEGYFGTTVFLQYVKEDGTRAFRRPGIAVTQYPPQVVEEAAVVAHAREGVLVAFRRDIDSETSRIVVQWFDGQGRPRWGAGALAAPVSGAESQTYPFLLASPDGGAFLCFARQAWDLPARSAIYCQRFSPEGQRLWGRGGARANGSPLLAEEPQALAAADGGLLVFWRDFGRPDGPQDTFIIRGQRLGPDGSRRWGDEARTVAKIRIPNPDAFQAPGLGLVSDGAGGAILAYDDHVGRLPEGADSNYVTAQRMTSDGEMLWGDGVSVVPSHPPHALEALIPGPDGGAFVGVSLFTFQAGGGFHLVFQRLAADGRSLWPAEGVPLLDPATSRDREIDGLAFGAFDGSVLRIAWEHLPVGARSSDILFTVLDPAGNRLTRSPDIPLPNTAGYKGLQGFALNPETGSSFVVWGGFDSDTMGLLYAPPP